MVVFIFSGMAWLLMLPHLTHSAASLKARESAFLRGRWTHRTRKASSRPIPTQRSQWCC